MIEQVIKNLTNLEYLTLILGLNQHISWNLFKQPKKLNILAWDLKAEVSRLNLNDEKILKKYKNNFPQSCLQSEASQSRSLKML